MFRSREFMNTRTVSFEKWIKLVSTRGRKVNFALSKCQGLRQTIKFVCEIAKPTVSHGVRNSGRKWTWIASLVLCQFCTSWKVVEVNTDDAPLMTKVKNKIAPELATRTQDKELLLIACMLNPATKSLKFLTQEEQAIQRDSGTDIRKFGHFSTTLKQGTPIVLNLEYQRLSKLQPRGNVCHRRRH